MSNKPSLTVYLFFLFILTILIVIVGIFKSATPAEVVKTIFFIGVIFFVLIYSFKQFLSPFLKIEEKKIEEIKTVDEIDETDDDTSKSFDISSTISDLTDEFVSKKVDTKGDLNALENILGSLKTKDEVKSQEDNQDETEKAVSQILKKSISESKIFEPVENYEEVFMGSGEEIEDTNLELTKIELADSEINEETVILNKEIEAISEEERFVASESHHSSNSGNQKLDELIDNLKVSSSEDLSKAVKTVLIRSEEA